MNANQMVSAMGPKAHDGPAGPSERPTGSAVAIARRRGAARRRSRGSSACDAAGRSRQDKRPEDGKGRGPENPRVERHGLRAPAFARREEDCPLSNVGSQSVGRRGTDETRLVGVSDREESDDDVGVSREGPAEDAAPTRPRRQQNGRRDRKRDQKTSERARRPRSIDRLLRCHDGLLPESFMDVTGDVASPPAGYVTRPSRKRNTPRRCDG